MKPERGSRLLRGAPGRHGSTQTQKKRSFSLLYLRLFDSSLRGTVSMAASVSERDYGDGSTGAEEHRSAEQQQNSSSDGPSLPLPPQRPPSAEAGSDGLPARSVRPDQGVPQSPFYASAGEVSGNWSEGQDLGQHRTPRLNLSGTTDGLPRSSSISLGSHRSWYEMT